MKPHATRRMTSESVDGGGVRVFTNLAPRGPQRPSGAPNKMRPLIDRINDRLADSTRWLGPILVLLGIVGMVAALVMHLWK